MSKPQIDLDSSCKATVSSIGLSSRKISSSFLESTQPCRAIPKEEVHIKNQQGLELPFLLRRHWKIVVVP